jgi:hypothetical protein
VEPGCGTESRDGEKMHDLETWRNGDEETEKPDWEKRRLGD